MASGAHPRASRRAAALAAANAAAAADRPAATAAAAATPASAAPVTRVLIVGGTGRVGASAAWSLLTDPDRQGGYSVMLASRSRASYDGALARRPQLAAAAAAGKAAPGGGGAGAGGACAYVQCDASDRASVDVSLAVCRLAALPDLIPPPPAPPPPRRRPALLKNDPIAQNK